MPHIRKVTVAPAIVVIDDGRGQPGLAWMVLLALAQILLDALTVPDKEPE